MTAPGASAAAAGSAAARLTGRRVAAVRPVSDAVAEAVIEGGERVVVKRGSGPGAALAEAAGLRWLAAAGAVPVPAVRGADEDWLVVDRVEQGAPDAAAAERFGRDLAALHAAGAPAFGAAPPGGPADAWIGRAPMRNTPAEPSEGWARWYAGQRVLPYVRQAVDRGALRPAEAEVVERVCRRLAVLAGPPEPPARLHGDLWQGNVLWGRDGRAWVIDPAAHGGHRESDLAMLHLFGCPHLDRVLGGYQQAAPLADGWQQRVPLHQLFPLLVHTVLFGRGYAPQAVAAAEAAWQGRP